MLSRTSNPYKTGVINPLAIQGSAAVFTLGFLAVFLFSDRVRCED